MWNTRDYLNGVAKTQILNKETTFSAVKHDGSYGNKQGLWEIAVWAKDGEWLTQKIFSDASDDVIGWLTWEQVNEHLGATKLWLET